MAEGTRDYLSVWREYRIEADEYRELDHERVLVLVHLSGRGRTSGVELEQMHANGARLFQLSGGKVTKLVVYLDRQRASRLACAHARV